jgi:hypothetical protein
MSSLILVVLTIAFLSTLALVSINYTPWWIQEAQTAQQLAVDGFVRLERAYDLAAQSSTPPDTPPAPVAESDGGLATHFRAHLGFIPKAPVAMQWAYGRQEAAGYYQGLDYFCLHGDAVRLAEYRGTSRVAALFGSGQTIVNSFCGAQASAPEPIEYPAPVAVTVYVQYVPGVP